MFAHGEKVQYSNYPGAVLGCFSSLLHNHINNSTGCTQTHRAFYLRQLHGRVQSEWEGPMS